MDKLKNGRELINVMIIGVTGSFGSGKTTISELISKSGFKLINVDKLYHGIYSSDKTLQKKILKEFGTLSRSKIKEIVFQNSSKLKKLNAITHPIIIKKLKKEIAAIKSKAKNIVKSNTRKIKINNTSNKSIKRNTIKIVVDIPLLFESKSEKLFDKIIVVKTNKKKQIERIRKKTNKYTNKEIEQIIKSQMPLKDKIKKADFVVDNSKTITITKKQVKLLLTEITQNP